MSTKTTTKTDTRMLPCQLTADEQRIRGIDLANAGREMAELKDQAKATAREFKDKMERVQNDINRLGEAVRNGVEMRETEVEIVVDQTLGWYKVYRNDTGDLVEDRALRHNERQTAMDMEG